MKILLGPLLHPHADTNVNRIRLGVEFSGAGAQTPFVRVHKSASS
jgi:hypothetical protein